MSDLRSPEKFELSRARALLPRTIAAACLALLLSGCTNGPHVISIDEQKPIDRALVETPSDSALVMIADGLTAPTAMCIDSADGPHKGTLLIAEGGQGDNSIRILAINPNNTLTTIFPQGRRIPVLNRGFEMYAPIGGMTAANGKIIVSHRDRNGMGMISAIGYDGSHQTIVADLPAQGDYSVTDVSVNPIDGRLYFGIGSATNSGVVGLDNWSDGWVADHPQFCDISYLQLKLLGYRFDTKNPRAGLFGGADIAVTAPYQPFNHSNQTRIHAAGNGKPTSAIYSVNIAGGDQRVEAHGVRYPRGLAFNEFGNLFFTNDGMEMRGTRPVKDDPDSLLRLSPGALGSAPSYGFPDYSTDLYPISDARFQPPVELVIKYGYPEISGLIDHRASGLDTPDLFRAQLLFGVFPSQSGAAKLDFVPGTGPFKSMRGDAIVALAGDRSPFATAGQKLSGPIGFKVVRVDVDMTKRTAHDFIRNTSGLPASKSEHEIVALERPCDVKFGPDGILYILDMGKMTIGLNGREHVDSDTGRLFKLVPLVWRTRPATVNLNMR